MRCTISRLIRSAFAPRSVQSRHGLVRRRLRSRRLFIVVTIENEARAIYSELIYRHDTHVLNAVLKQALREGQQTEGENTRMYNGHAIE